VRAWRVSHPVITVLSCANLRWRSALFSTGVSDKVWRLRYTAVTREI
jgi:hypothetical protein